MTPPISSANLPAEARTADQTPRMTIAGAGVWKRGWTSASDLKKRLSLAMAKDNLVFKSLAEVHPRFHTPAPAIVILGVWSAVLASAGKFAELIGGVIFVGWIFYGLGAAAIFPIRRASQGKSLPYRVPGYPWTPLLFVLASAAIVGNAVVLAFLDPAHFKYLAVAIVLFLLGLPAYLFWRTRPAA